MRLLVIAEEVQPKLTFYRNKVRNKQTLRVDLTPPLQWATELRGVGTSTRISLHKYAPPPPPPPRPPKIKRGIMPSGRDGG